MERCDGGSGLTMIEIRYHRPSTVRDACALGQLLGERGAFLAGGTELIPDYRRAREAAVELISLRDVAELRRIWVNGETLHIGSLTTVAELARSAEVEAWMPALSEAAAALGSPQIRSRATVGGNFCRAVSCADLPPVALAGNVRLRIASENETRELVVADFFLGSRRTVLNPGEILTELLVPAAARRTGMSFQRFALRSGLAVAVASVVARVRIDGGRITDAAVAMGAVAPSPILVPGIAELLSGSSPSTGLFERAAALCIEAARPIGDIRGSADFRREIVGVLARRALERATERALAEGLLS